MSTEPLPGESAAVVRREFAGNDDAAALVVGTVEVDAVVADLPARAQAVDGDAAAVLAEKFPQMSLDAMS